MGKGLGIHRALHVRRRIAIQIYYYFAIVMTKRISQMTVANAWRFYHLVE
jgi:hypothetical protein